MNRDGLPPENREDSPEPLLRPDLRVIRTRRLLGGALVALALEKGYQSVSIRDITERAQVGYATFFRHYRDKDQLLHDLLEGVLEELMALLEPLSAVADPVRTGTLVFRHAQEHSDLYRVLLGGQHALELLPRALEVGIQGVTSTFQERPDGGIPLEIAAHHIIRSFMALIEWWLAHDTPYPPEAMGRIFQRLIMRPTHEAALVPRRT